MAVLRVTQGLMVQRVLSNLNAQSRRILQLQEQLASGLRVNSPSDDPIDARRAINARAAIARSEQYLDNITEVNPHLLETDASLQAVLNNLQRTMELTVEGANGTFSQDQLETLAEEINQILENVLDTANHQTSGRSIFAGTRTTAPAYTATRNVQGEITAITYNGNDEDILVQVSDGISLSINENGPDVFQSPQDIFQLLIDIRDELRSGDQSSLQNVRLAELETARDQVVQGIARVGAVENRVERITTDTEDRIQQLRSVLSDSIDADFAEVVLNLNAQSNAFQAALSAAARVIQPSLLDFVR
ncbi:MAG: flagellar hook-associated protein FlgL [Candidatus Hydrogenedentes bacterium]|nr:flagellar hook-associated protein FlgL [Candidatus Hydrogenedentota bacterium]